jgi:DNA-binding transcriptional regulator YiaG
VRIHDKITNIQNSDDENEYMKSMLPKQKSYIPRFALLLNTLWSFDDTEYPCQQVQKESILRAEKLSEYFVNMAKLVKQDAREKTDLKNVSKDKMSSFDKFKAMYEADKDLNKSVVAEMLDVSRRTVYDWVKKLDK